MRSRKGNSTITHAVALNSLQEKWFVVGQRDVLLTCGSRIDYSSPWGGAVYCTSSPLRLSHCSRNSSLNQISILHILTYHTLKAVIPRKKSWEGVRLTVLNLLSTPSSWHRLCQLSEIFTTLQERWLAFECKGAPFICATLEVCHLLPVPWH